MELFAPSIKYHKEFLDGRQYYVFDEGCFLGLQVLGDDTEPCFEGSAFYELKDQIQNIVHQLETISYSYLEEEGGKANMELKFMLSDSEKYDLLFNLLNPDYKTNWEINYVITDVYDDYALVYNCGTKKYERAYYTKTEEDVEITSQETVYVMDVTENEKATIDTLRKLNGDTYECVSETLENAEGNFEKLTEAEAKIEEYTTEITTLNTEVETSQSMFSELQENFNAINEELSNLKEYKANVELKEKQSVIEKYELKLSEEILGSFKENLDNYTLVELDKELAYALVTNTPNFFDQTDSGCVPKEEPKSGIEAILDKYK